MQLVKENKMAVHIKHPRFTKKDKRKLGLLMIVVGLALIIGAFFLKRWEDRTYTMEGGTSAVELELANGKAGTFNYNGEEYVMRSDVDAYLIMGIDKDGPVKRGEDAWDGGQADMLQVLVVDHAAKTWQLLAIDRNTLVSFEVLNQDGTSAGMQFMQLCLAHGYSYGLEDGCMKTVKAVRDILLNRKMTGYYALNMGGINELNDLVGGVPITVTEEFLEIDPTLKVGETITLTGDDAEKFVRARMNMEDDRNELRMARQEVYLDAFVQRFDALSEDEILSIYDKMMDYVVTNMGSKTFADLISVCKDYTKLDSIKIKGTAQIENGFETFRMDDVDRIETGLKLFYERKA